MEGEVKGSTFKMNGHTLPGVNQKSVPQQVPPVGAQPIVLPPPPVANVSAMGGVGMAPPIMSKPSVAKIYDKPKEKRTEY